MIPQHSVDRHSQAQPVRAAVHAKPETDAGGLPFNDSDIASNPRNDGTCTTYVRACITCPATLKTAPQLPRRKA